MSETTRLGAYSEFTPISKEVKVAFEEATAGLRWVEYKPFAASTQVVAGIN